VTVYDATRSVTIGRIYVRSTVMRPNKKADIDNETECVCMCVIVTRVADDTVE